MNYIDIFRFGPTARTYGSGEQVSLFIKRLNAFVYFFQAQINRRAIELHHANSAKTIVVVIEIVQRTLKIATQIAHRITKGEQCTYSSIRPDFMSGNYLQGIHHVLHQTLGVIHSKMQVADSIRRKRFQGLASVRTSSICHSEHGIELALSSYLVGIVHTLQRCHRLALTHDVREPDRQYRSDRLYPRGPVRWRQTFPAVFVEQRTHELMGSEQHPKRHDPNTEAFQVLHGRGLKK